MKHVRTVHAIAAILSGAAIVATLIGAIRVAAVTIVVANLLQLWSLEIIRTAPRRRETRP